MVLSTIAFAAMLSLVKLARRELPAFEVMCWRAATSVPLAVLLVWKSHPGGLRGLFRVQRKALLTLRVVIGFCAMSSFYIAARGLSVADLSIIQKLQPILIAVLAPWVLGAKERSSGGIWLALIAGICGSALVLGPELSLGSGYAIAALVGTATSAGAHLAVRALGRTERASNIVLWFQLGVLGLSVAVLLGQHHRLPVPPLHLVPHLCGIGVAATIGQALMTQAYAVEKASTVAAASYVAPLWGVTSDLIIFRTVPGASVWLGGALIVCAGLLLVRATQRASEAVSG